MRYIACQKRKRTSVTAGTVYLPTQRVMGPSDLDDLLCIGPHQIRMELGLGSRVIHHRLAQGRKVTCLDSVVRSVCRLSQRIEFRIAGAGSLQFSDDFLMDGRRGMGLSEEDED